MNQLFAILCLALSGFMVVHGATNLCRVNCDVDFLTIGCYRDKTNQRALPKYIYNERDPSVPTYGGRRIDWMNWNQYFPGFVCRCAQKAQEWGYDLFGVQFYGECWAGHSDKHDYSLHGEDSSQQGCIGDDYQHCEDDSRYCVGKHLRNMVYRIVDTSCPEAPFEKVGCYNDYHNQNNRPLPDYLFTDRDPSIAISSGRQVDWTNWDVYVPEFACRCAKAAKDNNSTFFGMQFYGECWSGLNGHLTYANNGPSTTGCVDTCYEPCKDHSEFCSGKHFANYVYKLRDAACEVSIAAVGCFREEVTDLAMGHIFYNEVEPGNPNFGGKLLQWSDNYANDFSRFLCKCARFAKESGWEYFGVRELGLCVRSAPTITDYDKYGSSTQCVEGSSNNTCSSGSKLCRGLTENANFVYKINIA